MAADLTTLSAILKEVFLPPIRKQMIDMGVLFMRMQKTSDFVDAMGTKTIFPAHLGFSQAVGARGERETLPVAQKQRYQRSELGLKQNYGTIEVTGNVIRASRKDSGAFVRAVESEMTGMVEGLKKDINRQIFGLGNGSLGVVSGAPSGQVITLLVSNVSPGVLNFEEEMVIQAFADDGNGNPDEGNQHNGDITVVTIDSTANTITVTGSISAVVSTDILVRKGAANREMNGLLSIIDDGGLVDLLQNISAAAQRRWRAGVFENSGVLRPMTLPLIQSTYTFVEKNGNPSILVSPFELRDKYANLVVVDKRFVNKLDLDGGFTALEYNGKPWVADDQALFNTLFIFDEAKFAFHQVGDFDWLNEDGLTLRKISGVDSYEANLVYAANLATYRRNSAARLGDLTQ